MDVTKLFSSSNHRPLVSMKVLYDCPPTSLNGGEANDVSVTKLRNSQLFWVGIGKSMYLKSYKEQKVKSKSIPQIDRRCPVRRAKYIWSNDKRLELIEHIQISRLPQLREEWESYGSHTKKVIECGERAVSDLVDYLELQGDMSVPTKLAVIFILPKTIETNIKKTWCKFISLDIFIEFFNHMWLTFYSITPYSIRFLSNNKVNSIFAV